MKNYLKLSSLSLVIIAGLSMESFAMDEDEKVQSRPQVMTQQERIENLPSGQGITLRLDHCKLESSTGSRLHVTYEQIQAVSVFGPCVFNAQNISTWTKRAIESNTSIQNYPHHIYILANTDTLKKLWNEDNHQEVFSWIIL